MLNGLRVQQKHVREVSQRWTEGCLKRCLPREMRCPVKLLEKLISLRPPSLKQSGPLYLRPLEKPRKDVWFSTQPVGINKINSYVKELATLGGLDCTKKCFMNLSIRKTTVRKLQKAGISNDKIAAVTGHRNEQSLRDYATADMQDHQHISSFLSKTCTASSYTSARCFSAENGVLLSSIQLFKLHCVH